MTKKTYTARPIKALGAAAVVWLIISIVADLIGAAAAAIEVNMLSQMPGSVELDQWGAFPDDTIVSAITGLSRLPQLLVLFVGGFVVLKWMYRANRNAQAFARGLESTPPGAVYWYFVPIGNLWKPYEAMEETWRVSHDPENWKRTFAPDAMRWWWGFWLAGNIIGNISMRLGFAADNTGMLNVATVLELISSLLNIGAALALMSVVRAVTARQTGLIDQNWTRPEQPGLQPWSDTGGGGPF